MAEIDQIKGKIAVTEAELDEAKKTGTKDEVRELRTLLIEQQREKNILLNNLGKFSLFISLFFLPHSNLLTLLLLSLEIVAMGSILSVLFISCGSGIATFWYVLPTCLVVVDDEIRIRSIIYNFAFFI